MDYPIKLKFNSNPSTKMHIDMNSCFASVEQQANPHLREKPIVVAAYATDNSCILAPSVEAKRFGVKTGMRVKEGKVLCPSLVVLPPDPWKYRIVHLKLKKLLKRYSDDVAPKSIDEFVLDFVDYPILKKGLRIVGEEIRRKIKEEVGDYIRVSIGIAPNRFLAKTAAGLHKPEGLDEVNQFNFREIYSSLKLVDLCGIAERNAARLERVGIKTVLDFYGADFPVLKGAFGSICGYYWYARLRGWEIDNVEFGRKSYGNSYVLPKPLKGLALRPLLTKLVERMGARFRRAGYKVRGVHLYLTYEDHSYWHKGVTLGRFVFDSREIYQEMLKLLLTAPLKPVRKLAVSCFNITKEQTVQLDMFKNVTGQERLIQAIDKTNQRWGEFVLTSARMMKTSKLAPDRIAFGGVKELEEFSLA